jgi:periplasmic protein TonB
MATLLESGARPYGSTKGVAVSMVLHGALIALAVMGTAKVVLPPREKVEEHPILYVASPPPKPIEAPPKPLPEVKAPPKAKAPEKVFKAPPRAPAPRRVAVQPRPAAPAPAPQPKVPSTPALVAPTRVSVTLPAVDLNAAPTITDVVAPPAPEPIKAAGISREGSVKSSEDGDVDGAGGRAKGLGSGDSGRAYEENQVERAVQVSRLVSPRYPDALKSVGVEGVVAMRFIVGADGKVEPGSINVIDSPHALFTSAVRQALLNTRYRPAEAGGRSVRQLVEQTFSFKLEK